MYAEVSNKLYKICATFNPENPFLNPDFGLNPKSNLFIMLNLKNGFRLRFEVNVKNRAETCSD